VILCSSDGRYGLLINKNRLKRGERVLTPIGGALELTEQGQANLISKLGLKNEDFEKGLDLRFQLSDDCVGEYVAWFLSGQDRERDPMRELSEEWVEEADLLNVDQLDGATWSVVGYAQERVATTRTGQEGKTTFRIAEIYEVHLSPETLEHLEALANDSECLLQFVTAEEIQQGKTESGVEIGTNSVGLLDHYSAEDVQRQITQDK